MDFLEGLLGLGNNNPQNQSTLVQPGAGISTAGLGQIGQNNAAAGGMAGTGLGMNIGTGQLLLGGLGTLGSLWTAWNATDLAKKQFDFQKKMSTANYYNQIQSYNTNLEDRAYARYAMENKSPSEAAAYVGGHSLRPMV